MNLQNPEIAKELEQGVLREQREKAEIQFDMMKHLNSLEERMKLCVVQSTTDPEPYHEEADKILYEALIFLGAENLARLYAQVNRHYEVKQNG